MENVIFIKTNSVKYFKVSKTRKETMEKKYQIIPEKYKLIIE